MSEALDPIVQAPVPKPLPAATASDVARDAAAGAALRPVPDPPPAIRLRPSVAAPALARNRARWICVSHNLPEPVVRDVVFVAGELVALSVRQVHAPLDFEVEVGHTGVTVRIRDLGAGDHARSRPNSAGTRRNLQLVQCVAESWGFFVTHDGREMWARLAVDPHPE